LRQWNGIRVAIAGVAAALALICAAPAMATDYVVNLDHDDGNDDCADGGCTLREALLAAVNPADRVILPAGTYELQGNGSLDLNGDNIVGAGARTTAIVGNGQDRVITAEGGTNTIAGVTIRGGESPDAPAPGQGGGAVVLPGTSLALNETTVRENEGSPGGGIANYGTLTIVRSTVADNVASAATGTTEGGGLLLGGGSSTTVRNSTISGNRAASGEQDASGGGIQIEGAGASTLRLESSTLAGNFAIGNSQPDVGGTIARGPQATPSITITHTIIAAAGEPLPCDAGPFQADHNIVDDASCGATVADPLLGPLQDNGGPTDTQAIPAESPAVNTGVSCEATDQRSLYRSGACDIGAYEFGATTQPPPPPPPVTGGGAQDLPEPVAGENVNVLPKSGTVKVRLPGRRRFRTLTEGEQLPVGTIVDTLKGRVTLVAAGGQTADFYGGIFRIGQGKGAKPLTTLTLVEKLRCTRSGKASMAAKKKRKRRLWGDGSGRFRTKGKHSAATVVGTKWLVEDKCKSTLTRVTRGRVSVRDFVKKKTVIVRAGKRYVAKARR
jgi:hypothetical protein